MVNLVQGFTKFREKNVGEFKILFSVYCLMLLYICTFCENIYDYLKVIEGT